MSTLSTPDAGPHLKSVETGKLIVSQPKQLKNVLDLLSTLDAVEMRISERTGEDRSGDWSGSGAQAGSTPGDDQTISPREAAIRTMPTERAVLQKQLLLHIEAEIRDLRKMARHINRTRSKGAAYRLNELYSRIRRLNALLSDVLHASVEVVKRLFIRVFVDKQPVL